MKKIITLILALNMLIISFANAASFGVSVEKELVNEELLQTLKIIGKAEVSKRTMVSLAIRDESDKIVVLDQKLTANDGSYSFSTPMNKAGKYKAYINSTAENQLDVKFFEILSKNEYEDIIALFNARDVTSEKIIEYIALYENVLGIDTKYYNEMEEIKTLTSINLVKEKGNFTIINFNEYFNRGIVLSAYSLKDPKKADEITKHYDNDLDLLTKSPSKEYYESFSKMRDSIKITILNTIANQSYNRFSEIKEEFMNQTVRNAFASLNLDELDDFIKFNLKDLNFKDYGKLSTAKKSTILNKMKKNTTLKTVSDYTDYYNEIKDEKDERPPTGGGNSGGGGGSTGGNTFTPIPPAETETTPPVTTVEFSDLKSVPWAETAIKNLAYKKIVDGKEEGKFYPDSNITRAEFIKLTVMAFNLLDKNATLQFTDVSNSDWYYTYVASAVKNGIISGRNDGSFGGDDRITREDMSAILYRSISQNKLITEPLVIENNISDFSSISDYAKNAVLMLSNMKIVSGKGNNIFAPKDNATRAEACVMINNILEAIK